MSDASAEAGARPKEHLSAGHDPQPGPVEGSLAAINRLLHAAAGVTLILLLVWTVVDISGRTLLSRPLPGTIELTELAVVILVYLGLARAENQDAHIAVDLLYGRLGRRTQIAMRVFAGTLSFLIVTVMTWRLGVFAGDLAGGGFTTGVLRIPLYPIAMIGVVGSAAFGLAVLSNLIATIRRGPH